MTSYLWTLWYALSPISHHSNQCSGLESMKVCLFLTDRTWVFVLTMVFWVCQFSQSRQCRIICWWVFDVKKTFETNGLWILNFLKFSLDLLRTCFHLDMWCDLSIISTLFVMGSWARCFLCLFHNDVLGSLMKQAWLSAHNLSEIKTTKISVHYKLMHLFFLYEYISRLFFPNS